MARFKNKFLSIKGQKERLSNVVNVLKAPFTGGQVVANVKNPTIKKGLELVSNNPFKTAAVVGTVANIPKAVTLAKTAVQSKKERANAKALALSAKSAAKKGGGVLQPAKTTGLLDLSSLPSNNRTVSTTPVASTGGLLTNAQAATTGTPNGSRASPRTSPKRKRRKAKRSSSRPRRKSKKSRSRKKRYGTAKQYARKGGRSVKYTKNGQAYVILSDGRARFVKGKRKRR